MRLDFNFRPKNENLPFGISLILSGKIYEYKCRKKTMSDEKIQLIIYHFKIVIFVIAISYKIIIILSI